MMMKQEIVEQVLAPVEDHLFDEDLNNNDELSAMEVP
jgi:hypothetical protein